MSKDLSENAIGIHIILRNRAGTFSKILADLSGLKFEENSIFKSNPETLFYPSFHYSRYQNCAFGKKQEEEQYFYFTADISLEKECLSDAEKGAAILSLPSVDISDKQSKHNREEIRRSLNILRVPPKGDVLGWIKSKNCYIYQQFKKNNNKIDFKKYLIKSLLSENCLFQVTASPETYRAKLFNLLKNWDFYGSFAKEEVKAEIERAFINTRFEYEFKKDEEGMILGNPLAKLYLCCRYGKKPGALAAAINTLLFKKYDSHLNVNYVFNIMFLMDYFSYSPSVSYDVIYGRLEKQETWNKEDVNKVIERILICPISDNKNNNKNSWNKYANELLAFLGEDYNIVPADIENNPDHKNPENILIYRNDKPPCSISQKHHEEDRQRPSPDKGCDICRRCWWIKEFREKIYPQGN